MTGSGGQVDCIGAQALPSAQLSDGRPYPCCESKNPPNTRTHWHITGNCSDESAQKRAIFPDHGRPRKQKPPRERPCFPEQPPPDFRGCVCPLSVWFARRYGVKTSVSFRPLVLQRVRTRARKRLHNEKNAHTHTYTLVPLQWAGDYEQESFVQQNPALRGAVLCVENCVAGQQFKRTRCFSFSEGELCE